MPAYSSPRKPRSQRPRMHLLTLKGNVWWFRQGVPEAVWRVTRGPRFILVNLRTSDTAAAKALRDSLEAVTRLQFAEVKAEQRLRLELDGWSGGPAEASGQGRAGRAARPPAERGNLTRAALEAAEDSDEQHLIVQAAEAEADAMRPTQREAFEDALLGREKVARHLDTYLAAADLAPKTTNERRGLVMKLARWCEEKGASRPLTLDRIDRRTAGRYVAEKLEEMHPVTQGKHLTALRQYWSYLARRGHVSLPAGEALTSGWPWSEQRIEKRGKRVERGAQKTEERPFTDDEVRALLSRPFPLRPAWEALMRDALAVSLLSGMRQAEVLTLWAGEVIEEDGQLLFDIQQGKTDAAARKVPVHSSLADMVRGRMAGKGREEPLFHELAGERDPSDTFGKRFKRWREAVGVDDRWEGVRRSLVNFHSARRWFATKARHAGQQRETIADVIGHRADKQDVTFGVYAREASRDQRRACVEAVMLPLRC